MTSMETHVRPETSENLTDFASVPRILIVEDNLDVAHALELRLRIQGYSISLAHSGISGVEAAINYQPDAMILDIRMPGMDGFAVLSELNQQPQTRDIPVIVLSANVAEESKHRAKELGALYYLEKPYEAAKLLQLVKAALSK